jgi:hypothetical protein
VLEAAVSASFLELSPRFGKELKEGGKEEKEGGIGIEDTQESSERPKRSGPCAEYRYDFHYIICAKSRYI